MKRMLKFSRYLLLLFLIFIAGCGGGGRGGGGETTITQPPPANSTAKVSSLNIAITGLGQSIKVTNAKNVTLTGVVSSDVAISRVSVFNGSAETQASAVSNGTWSAQITLSEGDNNLRVIAVADDQAKTQVETNGIIIYYPNLAFNTPLTASTVTVNTGSSTNVIFTIGDPTANIAVDLYTCDNRGAVQSKAATMADNGVLPDEIQKDGIYTASASINESAAGYKYYRAKVTPPTGNPYFSEILQIWISPPLSGVAVSDTVAVADNAKLAFDQQLAAGKTTTEAADAAVQQLQKDPNVAAVKSTTGGGVWWVTKEGILGVYHPELNGQKSGGSSSRTSKASSKPAYFPQLRAEYYNTAYLYDRSSYVPGKKIAGKASMVGIATTTPNEIGSNKAIIISPFISNPNGHNFGNGDDYYVPWKTLKDAKSASMYAAAEVLNNGSINVSLDTFKKISSYGYIHVSSHGDNYFEGINTLWIDAWGPNADFFGGSLSQVVVYSGVKLPKNLLGFYDKTGYEDDLKAKRIAIGPQGFVVLLPSFFKYYLGKLPNSLVALSSCRSLRNNSLANAFLEKGAGAVVGYTDYVATSYAQNTLNTMINGMLAGKTLSEAGNNAIATYGPNDGDAEPAAFRMTGSLNLVFPSVGTLKNGSFEDGVLTPWTVTGDGRIIGQLGSALPTDGKYMAIISTGLGYTTDHGQIEQAFGVPVLSAGMTTKRLYFDWNFYSEEFKEYCGSQYQDSFNVKICEVDLANGTQSNCVTAFSRKIDDLCSAVSPADLGFDQGDVYSTGWRKNQSFSLNPYIGKFISVIFSADDVGDSIYDSAILVDNVRLVEQ